MSLDFSIYIEVASPDDADDFLPVNDLSLPTRALYLQGVFTTNITHNLGRMAGKVGLHELLWRPGYEYTKITPEFVDKVFDGYKELLLHPAKYEQYNPPNAWGTYEGLAVTVHHIIIACSRYPNGYIFRSI